jgi:hypothetical protein
VIGAKEFGSGLAGGCSPEMEIVSRREKLSLEREREGNVKVAGLSYWCCLHKKNAMEYDSRIFQRIKKRKLGIEKDRHKTPFCYYTCSVTIKI